MTAADAPLPAAQGSDARDADAPVPVDELGYEQARDELVRVVSALESGGATLEESLTLWERGNALADRCEQWLQGAKARLDAARSSAAGASAPAADRADEA